MRCAVVALLSLGAVACERREPRKEAPTLVEPSEAAAAEVRKPDSLAFAHLEAIGMECASCLRKVEQSLATMDGVYQIGFDLPTDSIFVSYDAKLGAPEPATRPMIALIEQAGFEPAWLEAESWPDGVEAKLVLR